MPSDPQNCREDLWDADVGWGPWGLGVMVFGRIAARWLASGQPNFVASIARLLATGGEIVDRPGERISPAFCCIVWWM